MSTKESVTIDLGYPVYATKFIDSKTIIATGGGGQGNNGIPNKITAVKCSFKVADSKKRLQKYREIVLPKNEDSPMCLDIAKNGAGGEEGHSVFIGCNQSTELLKSMSINNNLRKYNFTTEEHLRFVDAAQLEENLSIDNKGDYPKIIRLSSHCSLGCLMTSHYPSVIYVFNPELLELNFKYKPKEDVEILDFHLSPDDDGKTLCYITSSSIETISTITSNHLSSSNSNPATKKEFSSVNLSKVRYVDNSNVIITASLKNGKGVCIYKCSISEQSIISKCVISKKIRSITAFDISMRQDLIALAGNDTSVTLVKLSNFKVLKTFKQLHTFAITGVSFSPNGSKLASVSAANTLHVMKIPHNYSSSRSVVGSIFHYVTLSLFVLIIGLALQKGYENGQLLEAIELSKEYSQIGTTKAVEFSKMFYATLKEKIQGENVDGSEMSKYFHMDDWDGTKSFSRPQVSTTSTVVPSYASSSSLDVESTAGASHEPDSQDSNSARQTAHAETMKGSDDATTSIDAMTSSDYTDKETENADHASSPTDSVTSSGPDISSSSDASLEDESYDGSSEKEHTVSDATDDFTQSQTTVSPSPEVTDTSSLGETTSTAIKPEQATSSDVLPTESSVSESADDSEATQGETDEAETAGSEQVEPEVNEEEPDIPNREQEDGTNSDEKTGTSETEHTEEGSTEEGSTEAADNADQEVDNTVDDEDPEDEEVDDVDDDSDISEPAAPEEQKNVEEDLNEQEQLEEEPVPVAESSEELEEETENVQEESQKENLSEKHATADEDDESHYDSNWLRRYKLNSDSDDNSDDEIETATTSSTGIPRSASAETPKTSSSSQTDEELKREDISEPKSQSTPSTTDRGSYDTSSISSASPTTLAEAEASETSSSASSKTAQTQFSTPKKAEKHSGSSKQQRSSLYSRSNSKSRNNASSSNTPKTSSSSEASSNKPSKSSAPPKSFPTDVSGKDTDKTARPSTSSRTKKMPLKSKTGIKDTSSKKPVKLASKETPSTTVAPATDKPVTSMIPSESSQGTPKNSNFVKKDTKTRSRPSLKRSKKKNSGRKISSISRKSSPTTHPSHDEL